MRPISKGSKRFLERTQLFALAASPAGVETLISPGADDSRLVPPEVRAELGIGEARLSMGIEDRTT